MRFLAALLFLARAFAQAPYESSVQASTEVVENPANRGSAAVWQSMQKLRTRASLLMITAHPDDEDGGMLAWASRGKGFRVALLTLNRGEGGANVMSPDYFDSLGLVRTEELLAAGRYYGVEQFWTSMIDYGFSKTLDESVGKWGRENLLREVVRVVRMTRPLVIASVFVGGPSDGHGNHQAAGLAAREVFEMAGDPKVFPEQIREGLRPWKPIKRYAMVPPFGAAKSEFSVNVEVPEGDYDPLIGLTYGQISREGLGQQKSQNGGTGIPAAGKRSSPYHRFESRVVVKDKEETFFDGIDTSLEGIAALTRSGNAEFLHEGLHEINGDVEQAMARFSATHPESAAPLLARGMKKTEALIDRVRASDFPEADQFDVLHELHVKLAQFNNALAESLGVSVRAQVTPDQPVDPLYALFAGDPETFGMAIPGQNFRVQVHVASQSASPVSLRSVTMRNTDGRRWEMAGESAVAGTLTRGDSVDGKFQIRVPADAEITRPYFSRSDIEQPVYAVRDKRYLNQPTVPYPLEAWAAFDYEGAEFRVGRVVQSVKRITGLGTVFEPLPVGPAISVAISPKAGVIAFGTKSFEVITTLRSNVKGPAKGSVHLEIPQGWTSNPATADFQTAQDGEERAIAFQVTPGNLEAQTYEIAAVAQCSGREYREGYQAVGYPGLRPSYLYSPGVYRAAGVDVKIAADLKVGYVMGSGDAVPASLAQIGIRTTMLDNSALVSGDLGRFDVLILGVRAYAAREDLKTHNGRLLEYVRGGGVVIAQYNTPEFDRNYGPYPYSMGEDPEEVTDEGSAMKLLEPGHPVFTWPNRITERDFDGWVEERGSKFLKWWDPHYVALLSTQDANQQPQKGGLLYARYGNGAWVYCAYALYRQLPEGVPGAYRLLANLVSLAKNPGFTELR